MKNIEEALNNQSELIEPWFQEQWKKTPPLFYASVDLRHDSFKTAPIDTNLFPAGFHHLPDHGVSQRVKATQLWIQDYFPTLSRLLLIPENHTRNIPYWENVASLHSLLTQAGIQVRIGLLPDGEYPILIQDLPSGYSLSIEPLQVQNHHLVLPGFIPDAILLNHDFSSGVPALLTQTPQKILQPLSLTWAHRLKSGHFAAYDSVIDTFSQQINIDPWLLKALYASCDEVDFTMSQPPEKLVHTATKLFDMLLERYTTYSLSQSPFLVMKSDSGTYGRSVMMVHSPQELTQLNRRQRSEMATGKGGQKTKQVILQEGIYTDEMIHGNPAEPVLYLLGSTVLGGFYRSHPGKDETSNLNTPGMLFTPFSQEFEQTPRFYYYSVIARLAMLAAAQEAKNA